VELGALVRSYDQLVLDLDGCVWVGREAIPGSVEAIEALRLAGKRIAFVTNNPRRSAEEYVRKLWGLGVRASAADVVTVGGAVQHLLAERPSGRTAFVIGSDVLVRHVADAGLRVLNGTDLDSRAEVVVVGGTERFAYDDLKTACLALRRGADFVATSRDPTHPQPEGLVPGTGAILAAVEYGSGRRAEIVGKPEPRLLVTALDRLGEGRTLVVGDRLDTDVAAAVRAGLDAALVRSGGTRREEAREAPADARPTVVADDLAALVAGRHDGRLPVGGRD
jgi:HAD superfamily hydrolase (TIGR01450 family)